MVRARISRGHRSNPWVLPRCVLALLHRLMGLLGLGGLTWRIVQRESVLGRLSVLRPTFPVFNLQRPQVMLCIRRMAIGVSHIARRRVQRSGCAYRTQVFAPVIDLDPPVAVAVEMSMALAVWTHNPDIRAAAHEHDIAVRRGGDVDVVGFRKHLFDQNRSRSDGRARSGSGDGRGGDHHGSPDRLWFRLSRDRSLHTRHAAAHAKHHRHGGDGCSPPRIVQTVPRVPVWILCGDIGRLKGIFNLTAGLSPGLSSGLPSSNTWRPFLAILRLSAVRFILPVRRHGPNDGRNSKIVQAFARRAVSTLEIPIKRTCHVPQNAHHPHISRKR